MTKTLGLALVCVWMVACGGKTITDPVDPDPEPAGPIEPGHPNPPPTSGQTPPPPPTLTPPPQPVPAGSKDWQAKAFTFDRAQTSCSGDRFVRYEEKYAKWVGVVLCSETRYKIFLGETESGTFHEIGDYAGNGQDHCELVNPEFTIPNEDEVTSGGCTSCKVQMAGWDSPGAVPVYSRSIFGTPFKLEASWPEHNLYTASWYECGVSIP